jgi:hypothetical protein
MAIAKTKVDAYTEANKRARVLDLVFSGNYATGEVVVHGGVAVASDLATAIPIFYNYATSKFTFYEGSAAGTALSEKTNAEAYPTGCKCRVTCRGY